MDNRAAETLGKVKVYTKHLILRSWSPFCFSAMIVGGFYSEVALRNEKQKAQCILNPPANPINNDWDVY